MSGRMPEIAATHMGGDDFSVTTGWTDLTSASFDSLLLTTGTGLAAGLYYTHVSIVNTHATQTVYVMLAAGAGAVTNRIPVAALATREIPLQGMGLTTISLQGSGAATTGHITGWFMVRV